MTRFGVCVWMLKCFGNSVVDLVLMWAHATCADCDCWWLLITDYKWFLPTFLVILLHKFSTKFLFFQAVKSIFNHGLDEINKEKTQFFLE